MFATIADLFKALGHAPAISEALDKNVWTVRKWRQRKRIPSEEWEGFIRAAEAKDIELTLENLVEIHKRPARRRPHAASRRG